MAYMYDTDKTWDLIDNILEDGELWTPISDYIYGYGKISAEEIERMCKNDLSSYLLPTDLNLIDWSIVEEEINEAHSH